jgi:hypothetical protein
MSGVYELDMSQMISQMGVPQVQGMPDMQKIMSDMAASAGGSERIAFDGNRVVMQMGMMEIRGTYSCHRQGQAGACVKSELDEAGRRYEEGSTTTWRSQDHTGRAAGCEVYNGRSFNVLEAIQSAPTGSKSKSLRDRFTLLRL